MQRRGPPWLGLFGCVLMASSLLLPAFVDLAGTASGFVPLEWSLGLLLPVALLGVLVVLLLKRPALAAYVAGLWLCEVAFLFWMRIPIFIAGRSPWAWLAATVGGSCLLADAIRREGARFAEPPQPLRG